RCLGEPLARPALGVRHVAPPARQRHDQLPPVGAKRSIMLDVNRILIASDSSPAFMPSVSMPMRAAAARCLSDGAFDLHEAVRVATVGSMSAASDSAQAIAMSIDRPRRRTSSRFASLSYTAVHQSPGSVDIGL